MLRGRGWDQGRGTGRGRGHGQGQRRGPVTILGQGQSESQNNNQGHDQTSRPRRHYEDTDAFDSMNANSDVQKFFKLPQFHKSFLRGREFFDFVSLAVECFADDSTIRHQFLIRLTQCPYLETKGPIWKTIMELVQGGAVSQEHKQGLDALMDLMEEILHRIPHCRNSQPYITAMLALMERLPIDKDKVKKLKERLADPSLLILRVNDPSQNWSTNAEFIKEPILPDFQKMMNGTLATCYYNPIRGGYRSPAHYLETWYRMMREDFLGPLRTAIKDFTNTFKPEDRLPRKVRLDGGYHYSIEIIDRDVWVGKNLCLLQYSNQGLADVDWKNTDRLRNDDLMVLSNDHFKTARYGIITSHELKPAKNGQIWLRIDGPLLQMDSGHAIQPMAFYEPVRCVLERLKVVAARVDEKKTLPMNQYFVETRKAVAGPAYLTADPDMELVLPGGEEDFPLLFTAAEPDVSTLGLDFSQEKALTLALTHEFALIQGPPGTGKSYVGAMFVHIMMLNKDHWQNRDHGCMLLLSYKNHAIDQFIGECERMGMDMSRTVRIGSRSCQEMDKYVLRNRRKELQDRHEYQDLNSKVRTAWSKLEDVQKKLKYCDVVLKSSNSDMPFSAYSNYISGQLRYELGVLYEMKTSDVGDPVISDWIIGGDGDEDKALRSLDRITAIDHDYAVKLERKFPVDRMPVEKRRSLVVYWCECARREAQRQLVDLRKEHEKLHKEMEELRLQQDYAVVRRADIIATTTTSASKHGHLIDAVNPTIVLCEEAAEVLESHIVAPLTEGCQHVVLIGDHQQLRPSVNNFAMERRNLSISMFERLIANDLPSCRLKIQHRMHPTIGNLLVPHIYSSLLNHPCVLKYPEVRGVKHRMHFFTHNQPEQKSGEKSSFRNPYEAEYLVSLCHYLLQQDYSPDEITILTTYKGQMRLVKDTISTFKQTHEEPTYTLAEKVQLIIKEFADYLEYIIQMKLRPDSEDFELPMTDSEKKERMFQEVLDSTNYDLCDTDTGIEKKTRSWFYRRKREFFDRTEKLKEPRSKIQDVRVITVDNYQGEECKIILLSFVRSNPECNIGFLKWANRICVALSRAKHGFYAVGDFKLFAKNQKSDLWKKLCEQLLRSEQTMLSEKLEIVCRKHDLVRPIDEPKLFLELAPLGGCLEYCRSRLKCGHTCTLLCHGTDRNHIRYICIQYCQGKLECGHDCNRRCDVDGDETESEEFKYGQPLGFRQCQSCAKNIRCKVPIEITPETCGHTESIECADHAAYLCQRLVPFHLDCSHPPTVAICSAPRADVKCKTVITTVLDDCQHSITRECHDVLAKCREKVMKTFPDCEHEREIICYKRNKPIKCIVEIVAKRPCGHEKNIQCHEKGQFLRSECKEPVVKKLKKCDHTTEFECGKIWLEDPKETARREAFLLLAIRCAEKVTKKRDGCGHEYESECWEPISYSFCKVKKYEILACGHSLEAPCYLFDDKKSRGCGEMINVRELCTHQIHEECRYRDRSSSETCRKPCNQRCSHRIKCTRRCDQPCIQCTQPCENRCSHSKCTKLCYEECDRKPCEKFCYKTLPCGHRCGGLCGEICPTCSRCRPNTPTERRISFLPCKHDFLVPDLDKHMAVRENDRVAEVVVKHCIVPQCKTLIACCPRYTNQIKRYQQVTRLPGYTRERSWWYCKKGGHFLDYPQNTDIQTASNHKCDNFIQHKITLSDIGNDFGGILGENRGRPEQPRLGRFEEFLREVRSHDGHPQFDRHRNHPGRDYSMERFGRYNRYQERPGRDHSMDGSGRIYRYQDRPGRDRYMDGFERHRPPAEDMFFEGMERGLAMPSRGVGRGLRGRGGSRGRGANRSVGPRYDRGDQTERLPDRNVADRGASSGVTSRNTDERAGKKGAGAPKTDTKAKVDNTTADAADKPKSKDKGGKKNKASKTDNQVNVQVTTVRKTCQARGGEKHEASKKTDTKVGQTAGSASKQGRGGGDPLEPNSAPKVKKEAKGSREKRAAGSDQERAENKSTAPKSTSKVRVDSDGATGGKPSSKGLDVGNKDSTTKKTDTKGKTDTRRATTKKTTDRSQQSGQKDKIPKTDTKMKSREDCDGATGGKNPVGHKLEGDKKDSTKSKIDTKEKAATKKTTHQVHQSGKRASNTNTDVKTKVENNNNNETEVGVASRGATGGEKPNQGNERGGKGSSTSKFDTKVKGDTRSERDEKSVPKTDTTVEENVGGATGGALARTPGARGGLPGNRLRASRGRGGATTRFDSERERLADPLSEFDIGFYRDSSDEELADGNDVL